MSKKAKTTVATDPNPTLAADILTEFSALASRMAAANDRAAVLTNAKERAVLERLNVDDDGNLPPLPVEHRALLGEKWTKVQGPVVEYSFTPTPVFLAVDVATGQTLGVSLHSFAAAILDANRGAARETPLNWAFDGKEGQEYAGVVLQMGAL